MHFVRSWGTKHDFTIMATVWCLACIAFRPEALDVQAFEWVSQNKQTFFDFIDHLSQNKHVLQTLHNLEIPEKSIQSMITIGNKSDLVKEDDWKSIR